MEMWRFLVICCVILSMSLIGTSKSIQRHRRDLSQQLPVTHKQLGGGLSALGTLVSPLLFLMGMGSFISMLPQMFQNVLSGVGSNLIQSFTGGNSNSNSGAGGASTRLKRDTLDKRNLQEELEKRVNMAVLKYEGLRGI